MTLPLILPAVIAGAMLAFALSFDDLVVTSFNAGVGSTTLPIFIYSSIKFGVTPQINAISTIIVAVVSIALFIAWRLGAFRTERAPMAIEERPRPEAVGAARRGGSRSRGPRAAIGPPAPTRRSARGGRLRAAVAAPGVLTRPRPPAGWASAASAVGHRPGRVDLRRRRVVAVADRAGRLDGSPA